MQPTRHGQPFPRPYKALITMKTWFKWIVIGTLVVLMMAGVMRSLAARKVQSEALQTQQAAQKTNTPIDLQSADVALATTIELSQGLPISGTIKAVNSAVIKARVPGELQGLLVREGDFVKAGQIVARIDDTEAKARLRQAQQQAQSAKAQVDIAKRSFDNNRSLVEQGFISKTALDTSTASLNAAEANHLAAQAGADVASKALGDTVLRSPISGQVAQRLAQPGERVGVDARILEIVDISTLELEANLGAADSIGVKVGQTATLTLEGVAQPISAKVSRINPSATAGSRSVLAYLSIAPGSGLRQGLFAQGLLATGKTRSLAIPLTAVRTDKPLPYVQWLQDGKVVHQSVTLGQRAEVAGQTMVAVNGIAENTPVLLGTAGALREGTPVRPFTNAK